MKFLIEGEDTLPETDEEVKAIFEDDVAYNLYRIYRRKGESVIGAFQHVLELVVGISNHAE